MRILFVTWDGPQVSYLESLFLPIFSRLRQHGIHFDILQFRWAGEGQPDTIPALCEQAGCGYRRVAIRRGLGGPGAFATALGGGREIRRAVRAFGSDILMPRSHMPAIAVAAAGGARLRPILFDADGFAADEKVEFASLSASGMTYRILRYIEGRTVEAASSVIVRSPAAAQILRERAGGRVAADRFHVVTNGRDEFVFQPFDEETRRAVRQELGIDPGAPLIAYAGSVGPQYRFEVMRDFARAVAQSRPDARLLILSGSPELGAAFLGAAELHPIVMNASPGNVGRYLSAADLGLAFRADSFSMQGLAPLKLGEYLLCGVPILGNAAVGDTAAAISAGVFFDDRAGTAAAAQWLIEEVLPQRDAFRALARSTGIEGFSVRRSVTDYLAAITPVRTAAQGKGLALRSS